MRIIRIWARQIIPYNLGACQGLLQTFTTVKNCKDVTHRLAEWYNSGMDKFTTKQHADFKAWAKAHDIAFSCNAEYIGAITAFYGE